MPSLPSIFPVRLRMTGAAPLEEEGRMSRTVRTHPKSRRRMRDGTGMGKVSRSCEHHGGCPWCERGRLHAHARQAPLPERSRPPRERGGIPWHDRGL